MIVNWKVIAAFIGIAIFYEVLVVLLWLGFKWMLTPFITPGLKLFITIIFFSSANFSIVGLSTIAFLTALISLNLAIFNLLPLPALDEIGRAHV